VGERIHPLQPRIADRAAVFAEQLDDPRLAGHDRRQATQAEPGNDQHDDAEPDQGRLGTAGLLSRIHQQCHAAERCRDAGDQDGDATC